MDQLPAKLVNWQRDILPEHLWIEFLRQKYPETDFLNFYSELCDTLRSYSEGNLAFLGLVSDFGRIPENKRLEIVNKHRDLIIPIFAEPFGDTLRLYPKAPCFWLLPKEWLKTHRIPPSEAFNTLSRTLERLFPGKDDYCGYLRMVPFGRLFEEGKITFAPSARVQHIIELLPKYPHLLSARDRALCESVGRAIIGAELPYHVNVEWAKYFWRRTRALYEWVC